MGLFSKRSGNRKGGLLGDSMDIYVMCDRCGEIFKTHVIRGSELFPTYDEEGPAYLLRKELIGSKCPNRIQLYIEFNGAKQIIKQETTGDSIQEIKEL
jgi:hypothetical protein